MLKAGALRHRFVFRKRNIVDALCVLTALVLELVFFERNAGAAECGSLVIIGRFWRIGALLRNYVVQLKRAAELRLRREFELRMNAENEVLTLRADRDALEVERNALRELIERNGVQIPNLVTQHTVTQHAATQRTVTHHDGNLSVAHRDADTHTTSTLFDAADSIHARQYAFDGAVSNRDVNALNVAWARERVEFDDAFHNADTTQFDAETAKLNVKF